MLSSRLSLESIGSSKDDMAEDNMRAELCWTGISATTRLLQQDLMMIYIYITISSEEVMIRVMDDIGLLCYVFI